MITLDDFKKFDFRHITTQEFFEIEGLLAQLIIERGAYRETAMDYLREITIDGFRKYETVQQISEAVDADAKSIWDKK